MESVIVLLQCCGVSPSSPCLDQCLWDSLFDQMCGDCSSEAVAFECISVDAQFLHSVEASLGDAVRGWTLAGLFGVSEEKLCWVLDVLVDIFDEVGQGQPINAEWCPLAGFGAGHDE